MRTVIITKGLPGSGKSTWAKEQLAKEPDRWRRVNRDDIRAMMAPGSSFSKSAEEFVRNARDVLIRKALACGYDVIIDDTNLVAQTIKKLHGIAQSIGDVKVIEKPFNVSLDECLRRNALREGRPRVPDNVITGMAKGAGITRGRAIQAREEYYPPLGSSEPLERDSTLPKAIMCDLDGTLAIISDRSPYDATDCDLKDLPNWPVINAVKAMQAAGYAIVFMSGRDSKYRPETERFIKEYCNVPYELFMRSQNDVRKDSIIKRELYDEHVAPRYYVEFVYDDRDQVVQEWRSMGIPCFQVAPGNF